MGISQTRLISLENGRDRNSGRPTIPSPQLILKIAQAYQYPKQQMLILAGYMPWVFDEAEAGSAVELIALAAETKFDQDALARLKEFAKQSPEQQMAMLSEPPQS